MILKRPAGVFTAVGRERLAHTLVWGQGESVFKPHIVERRIVRALECIAAEMEDKENAEGET